MKNPRATILIIASRVNNTVKQLSRYPMNTIIGSSGSAKGLSITKVIELIKISERMIPSNIEDTLIWFLLLSYFINLDISFDVVEAFYYDLDAFIGCS